MSKLNLDLPILLIDTSYWLYYRFFSLRNWYYRAYPEKYSNNDKNSFNADYNWFEDKVFMTKYKKLFIENIKKICKKFNTKMENVVFCIDCPHNEIWRKTYITKLNKIIDTKNEKIKNEKIKNEKIKNEKIKNETNETETNETETHTNEKNDQEQIEVQLQDLIQEYKGTRLESHKKNRFNSFNIFSYIKTTFLSTLKDNNNNLIKIISCSQCEADDIIGHLTLYIQNLTIETKPTLYILANDHDYLQLCNDKVKLINGVGKIISVSQNGNCNTTGDYYLLSKILLGDKSDNIKCCVVNMGYICSGIPNHNFKNVGKSCIHKLFSHPDRTKLFYDLLITIRNEFFNTTNHITDGDYISNGDYASNNSDSNKIIDMNKFKHNCIMMDFQLIPLELKTKLNKLFAEII